MCDTLIALGEATEDGSVIFGKNSDRPQDEVQLITYAPRTTYSKGDELKCTYISIPQVKETAAILLSQPWWMWGAEMGANEYGVVIGNEAIYTNEPLRNKGLLGMDLLRLGLERGKNAIDALKNITALLEKYHQGGGCAYHESGWTYHNSFLIADTKKAYVLETADDWWIVEKVKDVRSISNGASIRGKGDMRREGIIQYAVEKNYCTDDEDFDFALTFSGSLPSTSPYSRSGRSALLLNENKGKITPKMMMDFLRDHEAGICMHGGFESTGSQVSHLTKETKSFHWFTGTTIPCLSAYKPYGFPAEGQKCYPPGPYSEIDPNWSWVKHSKKKSRKIMPKLRKYEDEALSRINEMIKKKEQGTKTEFMRNLNQINNEIWQKSENLL